MGGFINPSTTIGGTVLAPGIPLASSPLNGLYQSGNGYGFGISGNSFYELNSASINIGEKIPPTYALIPTASSPFVLSSVNNTNNALTPDGRYLYVSDNSNSNVKCYQITTSGIVSLVGTVLTGPSTHGLAVDPSGEFLILSGQFPGSTIIVYSINRSTGALTLKSSIAPGNIPGYITLAVIEHVLYAYVSTSQGGYDSLWVYTINNVGAISLIATHSGILNGFAQLSVTPDGNYLFGVGSTFIYSWSINNLTGDITPLSSSPFSVTGSTVVPGVISTNTNIVIGWNNTGINTQNLQSYNFDRVTGQLSLLSTSTSPSRITGPLTSSIDGTYILTPANYGFELYSFNNATGILGLSTVYDPATTCFNVFPTPSGLYLLVITADPSILIYQTGSTVSLPLVMGTFDPTGGLNGSLQVNGNFNVTGQLTNDNQIFLTQNAGDTRYAQLTGGAGAIFTGAVTPSQLYGMIGTTTNNNVQAGSIGEYIESTVLAGAAVALTTAVAANVTSIALSPGDWDVEGVVLFHGSGTTSVTDITAGSNSVSVTVGAVGSYTADYLAAVLSSTFDPGYIVPRKRYSIAANTTIYLIAESDFTLSTLTAYGHISARRVR